MKSGMTQGAQATPPETEGSDGLAKENQQLRELLARRTHELELASRLLRLKRLTAVDQLAAGLAHEINNPLGTIMAFTQILIREGRIAGEDLEALRFIEQSALRCKRVIEAVVHHSSQSDGAAASQTAVPLDDLARTSLAMMRPQIDASGALVHVSLGTPSPRVLGTLSNLQRVVHVLLSNALDATRGAGRPCDIKLSTFARGDKACLSVRDNGRGIAAGLRDKIFEPFFTTKIEGEAAGLGLATADRIAQSHGGLIEVDSEPDLGSTFTLVLPILGQGEAEARANGRTAEQ